VDFPNAVGSPRYFSTNASELISVASSFISGVQLPLKNIADFSLLTSCPDP
jgi:hypothetical protein